MTQSYVDEYTGRRNLAKRATVTVTRRRRQQA